MGWRDHYRQASFKGCPFFVAVIDSAYGRRGAHHEFPQRDSGFWEDLGDSDPRFTVDGYLTERSHTDGYMAARDALEKACRTSGPGALVHPYKGEILVTCLSMRVTEDKDEGGICRISFEFLETAERPAPAAVADTAAAVDFAADAAFSDTLAQFESDFDYSELPSYVAEETGSVLDDALDALGEAADTVGSAVGEVYTAAGEVYDATIGQAVQAVDYTMDLVSQGVGYVAGGARDLLQGALSVFPDADMLLPDALSEAFAAPAFFADRVASLVSRPLALPANLSDLGPEIGGLVRTISPLAGSADRAFGALTRLTGFGDDLPPIPLTTANRKRQATLRSALCGLVRRAAAVEAARLTPRLTMESRSQALDIREAVTGRLDAIMEAEDTGDDLYATVSNLRAAVVANITERAPSLARVATLTPRRTTNTLVQSYELYGDLSREAQIIARNNVRCPARLAGGDSLEVLV